MPSAYPGALDALSTALANATLMNNTHPTHHNDMADAINKIEAELGINPSGSFATVGDRLGSLSGSLNLGLYNVKSYGAVGDGVANDTSAINAALTAASGGGGGIVLFPPGTYATTGGHTIPDQVTVVGSGMFATKINHSGNNVCFLKASQATQTVIYRAGIRDLTLRGNSGASAVGIEVNGSWGFTIMRVQIGDHASNGYSNGVGLLLHNKDADTWVEGLEVWDLHIRACKRGIVFKRTGGTNSFGYTKFHDFTIALNDGQTGIDFGSDTANDGSHTFRAYNSIFEGHIWLGVNNCIGVDVYAPTELPADTRWNVTFEPSGGGAAQGTYRFRQSGGKFVPRGPYSTSQDAGDSTVTAGDSTVTGGAFAMQAYPKAAVIPGIVSYLANGFSPQHAGISAIKDASGEEGMVIWGYSGNEQPVLRVVGRGFSTMRGSEPFDATQNVYLVVEGLTGHVGIKTDAPASALDINANSMRIRNTFTPTGSADSSGQVGDFRWDANFIYVKTATGWKRATLATF